MTTKALNPYVLKVISAYPLDGSYPYHCGWTPREYDIYNGVTQDLWYRGMVVAKAYPDGSRCSYCCGFTFEAFVRAMKLRNIQKGIDPDDFNGMSFADLFNMLQFWYIEGTGDSEQRGITAYGLGHAVTDLEQARPATSSATAPRPPGGHAVIFIGWTRDAQNKIVGLKYFSSNLSGTHGVGFGSGRFSDCNANGRGHAAQLPPHRPRRGHQGLQALRPRQDSAAQRLRAHAARADYVRAGAHPCGSLRPVGGDPESPLVRATAPPLRLNPDTNKMYWQMPDLTSMSKPDLAGTSKAAPAL